MNKLITVEQAAAMVKDGMSIMVGGFLGVGSPELVIDKILENGTKDLTLIANDTSFPDQNYGKLVANKRVSRVFASHIGTNPETGRQMNEKETEVNLIPQGTLAEQIRAAGAGLGGIITPTGLGTIVEDGKQKIEIDGMTYLVEKPLKADVALIRGAKVDKKGNVYYALSAKNFNPLMATAADVVIVEADEIVEVGGIDPECVMTPHIFVTYIIDGGVK